jgi:hypothetical protein
MFVTLLFSSSVTPRSRMRAISAIPRDAEAHHAARDRPGIADRDRVSASRELVGG